MPVLRSTVLIDAPPRVVAGLLRDADVAGEAWERAGHRSSASSRLLSAGAEVQVVARLAPGIRVPLRTVVQKISGTGMTSVLTAGPRAHLAHTVTLTPTAAGTLVLDELSWTTPLGPLGRVADVVLLRGIALRLLAARSAVLVGRAAVLAAVPVVVAAALVRGGKVLAAQRTRPPALAGRWELPGGRVEAGEAEVDAVARECREELAVAVRTTGRLGTDLPIDAGVLRVHTAELLPGAPEPVALEHAALRWVGPDEVEDVDWLAADRAVLPDLRALLEHCVAGAGSVPAMVPTKAPSRSGAGGCGR